MTLSIITQEKNWLNTKIVLIFHSHMNSKVVPVSSLRILEKINVVFEDVSMSEVDSFTAINICVHNRR